MTDQPTLPGMERGPGRGRRPRPAAAELVTGDDLKRRGIEQVLKNERAEWRRRALGAVLAVANTRVFFTIDHVQAQAARDGLGPPHHPNVWGGVIRSALALGIMTKTGDLKKGSRRAQHGRPVPVYRRTDTDGPPVV